MTADLARVQDPREAIREVVGPHMYLAAAVRLLVSTEDRSIYEEPLQLATGLAVGEREERATSAR